MNIVRLCKYTGKILPKTGERAERTFFVSSRCQLMKYKRIYRLLWNFWWISSYEGVWIGASSNCNDISGWRSIDL